MSVQQTTGRDADGATEGRSGSSRTSGGSHRATRRGPSLLALLAAVLVVAVVAVVGFLVLAPGDEGSATAGEQSAGSSGPQPAPSSASEAGDGDSGDGATELATQEGSVAAGEALARNPRLEMGEAEQAELEEGRVDIRVLSLLALLSADHDLAVADFSAPDDGDGSRPAYVVELGAVDGGPVTAPPGQDVADVARDQLGVYRPDDVSVQGGVLRISFTGRDSDDLPPVPLP